MDQRNSKAVVERQRDRKHRRGWGRRSHGDLRRGISRRPAPHGFNGGLGLQHRNLRDVASGFDAPCRLADAVQPRRRDRRSGLLPLGRSARGRASIDGAADPPLCDSKNRRGKYFDSRGPANSGGAEGPRCRSSTASHLVGGSCMTHFEAVEVIASRLTNQIVISNVGNTNRELYSVKKHKLTLYGVNMSLVTPLAFGLAKAIPQRKVIALDGDGSILMGLKTLATVGTHPAKKPAGLGS